MLPIVPPDATCVVHIYNADARATGTCHLGTSSLLAVCPTSASLGGSCSNAPSRGKLGTIFIPLRIRRLCSFGRVFFLGGHSCASRQLLCVIQLRYFAVSAAGDRSAEYNHTIVCIRRDGRGNYRRQASQPAVSRGSASTTGRLASALAFRGRRGELSSLFSRVIPRLVRAQSVGS